MAGRRVASVVHQSRDSGEYDATWDLRTTSGSRVRAGVYFVKFQAAGFEQSTRLVVIK